MDTQKVREKYKKLSDDVRDGLNADAVPDRILRIVGEFHLGREKISHISAAIAGLVTQELSPAGFVDYLKENLGVSYDDARKIAAIVKNDILQPIKTPLQQAGVNIDDIPAG